MNGLDRLCILECSASVNLDSVVAAYASLPEIAWAEKDYLMELFEVPNDSLFAYQWSLNNTGQEYPGVVRRDGNYNDTQEITTGSVDADIDALEVFVADRQTSSPLIGIIDAGIDLDHEDLVGQIWVNPGEDLNGNGIIESSEIDGIDNDADGYIDDFYGWDFSGDVEPEIVNQAGIVYFPDNDPTDYHGHGTHVTGIAAAASGNGIGIAGIASSSRVMALKVFPYAFTSVCVEAIVYAADHGCDVINLSWGSNFPSVALKEALDYAVSRGTLPVAASGNAGHLENFHSYPAAYDNTLAVGASNSLDEVTYFSSYGDHIDVVAPGRDILSLRADSLDPYELEPWVHIVAERYYLMDGTSMAAPCVTGLAAYLRALAPQLGVDSLRRLIELSADDIVYPYGGDSLYAPGKDVYSGYGRVNLNRALGLVSGRLVDIVKPAVNQPVSGKVIVTGTALGEADEFFVLEYGVGYEPQSWIEIAGGPAVVYNDTLGVWNSSGLVGRYCLRLSIGDTDKIIVPVVIDNGVRVEIDSPSEGASLAGTVAIYGSTVLPNFKSYRLDYSGSVSPSTLTDITESTRMRADELLGEWPVSFLETGEYEIHLTVFPDSGEAVSTSVAVHVASSLRDFWTVSLPYDVFSPAVGDIDGDSLNEIVLGITRSGSGNGGGVWVFDLEGHPHTQGSVYSTVSMNGPPALGNLDDDGVDDIVITSPDNIYSYLSGSSNWSAKATSAYDQVYGLPPLICDLENDGKAEVLYRAGDWLYGCYRDGLGLAPGFQIKRLSGDLRTPMVLQADLDGDGPREIITGGEGLFVMNEDFSLIREPGDPGFGIIPHGMAAGNLDSLPGQELVVIGETDHLEPYTINVLRLSGDQLNGFPIVLEDLVPHLWLAKQPALGDLDGDGSLEIVVSFFTAGEARLYAWHNDGTPLGSIGAEGLLVRSGCSGASDKLAHLIEQGLGDDIEKVSRSLELMSVNQQTALLSATGESDYSDPVLGSGPDVFGNPILADINGDHYNDIVLFGGTYLHSDFCRLYAFDYEGRPIDGFPIVISPTSRLFDIGPSDPSIGDIDRDGFLDILTLTDYPDACLSFWEFPIPFDSSCAPWPKYLHDNWNSGLSGFKPDPNKVISRAPRDLRVQRMTDSSIVLAWTPQDYNRSTGYRLYRTGDLCVYPHRYDSVSIEASDSCYDDIDPEPGGFYSYAISNFDYYGQQSDLSDPVAVWFKPNESILGVNPPPLFRLAAVERDAVTLKWLSVPNVNIAGYNIYRAVSRYGTPELMNDVLIPRTDSVFYDAALVAGERYHYTIASVDTAGTESLPSLDIGIWCGPDDGPTDNFAPDMFQACNVTDSSIVVCWEAKPAWQSSGYHIYRSEIKDCIGKKIHNFTRPLTDSSYEDRTVKVGRFYYYSIINLDTLGEMSAPSVQSAVSFEPGAQEIPGIPPYSFRIGYIEENSVTLRWQPRPPWKSVGYNIYRSFGPGTSSIKINDELIPQIDSSYKDRGLITGLRYFYYICSVDSNFVEGTLSTAVEYMYGHQMDYELCQSFPNPFNENTWICFVLPIATQVKIDIYDCLGRRITTVVDQPFDPGTHGVVWNGLDNAGSEVASGVYFYRLTAGETVLTKKMLLLR